MRSFTLHGSCWCGSAAGYGSDRYFRNANWELGISFWVRLLKVGVGNLQRCLNLQSPFRWVVLLEMCLSAKEKDWWEYLSYQSLWFKKQSLALSVMTAVSGLWRGFFRVVGFLSSVFSNESSHLSPHHHVDAAGFDTAYLSTIFFFFC